MLSLALLQRLPRPTRIAIAIALAAPAAVTAQTAAFLHVVTAANRPVPAQSVISHPILDGRPGAVFFVRHVSNPPGATTVLNPHPVDVYYDGSHWRIENADIGTLSIGAAFNVWVPELTDPDPAYYVHATTDANSEANYTILEHPDLNGNPDAVVTINLDAPLAPHPHNLGAWYSIELARWTVFNQDQSTMPTGLRVFVGVYWASMFIGRTAYATFESNAATSEGNVTFIGGLRHHWSTQVTPVWKGVYLDAPLGTYWDEAEGEHGIFVETLATMPFGVDFHRLTTTGIFMSRFETGDTTGWIVVSP